MRRSFADFSAEVYRRRDDPVTRRKKTRVFLTYFAPIAICLTLFFSSVLTIPFLLKGGSSAPGSGGNNDIMDGDNSPDYGNDPSGGNNDGKPGDGDNGDVSYPIAISYVTVYTESGRTVYNDADDIWDVFMYVEDYPDSFKYSENAPKDPDGAYYKVMVCLRDGTTFYYLLDRLDEDEVANGFSELMQKIDGR
ncbi:MAG: hypothetical protein IJY04_08025 [Clostridia bacterium]|nr:hypothetical protein [Clostridia bacterium]